MARGEIAQLCTSLEVKHVIYEMTRWLGALQEASEGEAQQDKEDLGVRTERVFSVCQS